MAIKHAGKWLCGYCHKEYPDQAKADSCRDGHDLIYVPFTPTDLNRLLNFIYLKDDSLLTKSLMATLNKYLRGNK